MKNETGMITRKHGGAVPCANFQLRKIAESVQHGYAGNGRQQKGEYIPQTQVVIDVAQQHQQQYAAKAQPPARGQDKNAALIERDSSAGNFRAEQPSAEFLLECGEHVLLNCHD